MYSHERSLSPGRGRSSDKLRSCGNQQFFTFPVDIRILEQNKINYFASQQHLVFQCHNIAKKDLLIETNKTSLDYLQQVIFNDKLKKKSYTTTTKYEIKHNHECTAVDLCIRKRKDLDVC